MQPAGDDKCPLCWPTILHLGGLVQRGVLPANALASLVHSSQGAGKAVQMCICMALEEASRPSMRGLAPASSPSLSVDEAAMRMRPNGQLPWLPTTGQDGLSAVSTTHLTAAGERSSFEGSGWGPSALHRSGRDGDGLQATGSLQEAAMAYYKSAALSNAQTPLQQSIIFPEASARQMGADALGALDLSSIAKVLSGEGGEDEKSELMSPMSNR